MFHCTCFKFFFRGICQTHQLFLTENVMRESFLAACHAVMLNMCHVQLCNSTDSSLKTFQKCTSTVFNSLTFHFCLFFGFFLKNNTHHPPPTKNTNIPSQSGPTVLSTNQPHINDVTTAPFKGHSTHVHLEDGRV